LSGRGLCDELITRPEESYRLCCVVVCDLETSRMGAPYIYDVSRLRVKFHVNLVLLTAFTQYFLYLCQNGMFFLNILNTSSELEGCANGCLLRNVT